MNQYKSDATAHNLFGSTTGFIGSADKSQLAKALEKFSSIREPQTGNSRVYELSNIVLLFDKLEKAHRKVQESILALL